MTESDETTSTTDRIACPHCGYRMYLDDMQDGETRDDACGSCDRPVRISCSISVTYAARAR